VAFAALAEGQGRRPGLYETTSEMTWQQSPFPPGMTMPPEAAAAFGGGKRTSLTCVTQGQIDRYGAVPPQNQRDCRITNVSKVGRGMRADMVCAGEMPGKGTVESAWLQDGRSKGKIHFTGTMQDLPVEWTIEYISAFKEPDCGSVKPASTD
jgi:hypothetical protein